MGRKTLWPVMCVAYLALELFLGRFTHTDEVFFKAAGMHLALEGRFVAPELEGRLKAGPPFSETYLAQPPLYTALYGAFTALAGFGPRQAFLFDALIHVGLVWLMRRLVRRLAPEVSQTSLDVASLLLLAMGTPGRPDEMAAALGGGALVALLECPAGWMRTVVVGALMGLCAATSVGAAILGGLAGAGVALLGRAALRLEAREGLGMVATSACTAALCVAPILVGHPDAWVQYSAHAAEQSAVMGTLLRGDPAGFGAVGTSLAFAWQYGKSLVLPMVAVLVAAFLSGGVPVRVRHLGAGVLAALAWLLAVFPAKYLYLWMLGPQALVLGLAALAGATSMLRKRAVAFLLVAGALVGVAPWARTKLALAVAPPEQGIAFNQEKMRALVPAGVTVLASEGWWLLGDRCLVREPLFNGQPPDGVDVVLQTGNGSGTPGVAAGIPAAQEAHAQETMEVVWDGLPRTPPTLLGIPLTRSGYGFGMLVRARRGLIPVQQAR